MKFYKAFLHFLITLVSAFAFLTGWATLAHSLKPIQPVDQQQLMALEPLQPVGLASRPTSNGLQWFSASPRPRTRSFATRGS